MSNKRFYSQEVKDQIIGRIKNEGLPVIQVAKEHGLSDKTVYGWLTKLTQGSVSVLEYGRLKKENKLLLELIGKLTLEKEKSKALKKN